MLGPACSPVDAEIAPASRAARFVFRHSGASRNPGQRACCSWTPAFAGVMQKEAGAGGSWTPAFAGVTQKKMPG